VTLHQCFIPSQSAGGWPTSSGGGGGDDSVARNVIFAAPRTLIIDSPMSKGHGPPIKPNRDRKGVTDPGGRRPLPDGRGSDNPREPRNPQHYA